MARRARAGAVRHGISRALLHADAALRPSLKAEGLLTRDPRMRERKKHWPTGRSQTFPIQQTLIELEFCKTRWPNGRRVFCFMNTYEVRHEDVVISDDRGCLIARSFIVF